MKPESKRTIKQVGTASAIGLNAAAILFLYTHFVPRVEYNKLESSHIRLQEKYEVLKERVVVQEATLNVYRGMTGAAYE